MEKKKRGKKGKKVGQAKAINAGLEDFMDWVDQITSELVEEREDDMSSLAVGFVTRMCKQAMSAKVETTPDSEVLGGKYPKRSSPNEEA